MSQQELATTSGCSVGTIRKLEQGQRQSARLETLAQLAHALDVTVGDLVGKRPGPAAGAEDSDLVRLRRAVLGVAPVEGDVLSGAQLQADMPSLWRRYWSGNYAVLARELPGRITVTRAALSTSSGPAWQLAQIVLAELLQLAASLLAHLAHEDLAHLALHGASRSAEAAGDELLHASQQATRSWIMSRQGLWLEAEQVAVAAAAMVEPVLSRASVDQVAVWGELLRYAAVALSRGGRHAEAADVIRLMKSAAARMVGDRATRYTAMAFGPTVVGMRAVDAAISAGQPRRALDLAVRVEHLDAAPATMQMRYLLNVAWAETLDWRSAEAVHTLLRAEALAPISFPHHKIARLIVAELTPRRGTHRLPGLASLADRINAGAA